MNCKKKIIKKFPSSAKFHFSFSGAFIVNVLEAIADCDQQLSTYKTTLRLSYKKDILFNVEKCTQEIDFEVSDDEIEHIVRNVNDFNHEGESGARSANVHLELDPWAEKTVENKLDGKLEIGEDSKNFAQIFLFLLFFAPGWANFGSKFPHAMSRFLESSLFAHRRIFLAKMLHPARI